MENVFKILNFNVVQTRRREILGTGSASLQSSEFESLILGIVPIIFHWFLLDLEFRTLDSSIIVHPSGSRAVPNATGGSLCQTSVSLPYGLQMNSTFISSLHNKTYTYMYNI